MSERTPEAKVAAERGRPTTRMLAALGVVSVCLLTCGVNVLASRFFRRFDVTSTGLYSITEPTIEVLGALHEPVEVVVFLPAADPLSTSVRYLLDAYRAHTPWFSARYVDPDRDPATFVALQREYGVFDGRTENGRLASEASIAVVRGERRWFITTDDLVEYDDEGMARPRLEQVLTEGLVNVVGATQTVLCFSQGHGELSIEDGGPDGLRELRSRLERNNYKVVELNPSLVEAEARLAGCAVVVLAGPQEPFDKPAIKRLSEYWETGGSLLIAMGAELGEPGRSELGAFLASVGIQPDNNLIFETDPERAMPIGLGGEVFMANVAPHAITRSIDSRQGGGVIVRLVQSLTLDPNTAARSLLTTSPHAFALPSLDGLDGPAASSLLRRAGESARQFVLAATLEVPREPDVPSGGTLPSRLVVLGASSPLWGATWQEPGLLPTRRFVENTVSWLAQRTKLVSVPEKPAHAAGLALTEAALGEVRRYVLLYMPLSAALVGLLLLLRRRHEAPHEEVA